MHLESERDPLSPKLPRAIEVGQGYVPYAYADPVVGVVNVSFYPAMSSLPPRSRQLSVGLSLGGMAGVLRSACHLLGSQFLPFVLLLRTPVGPRVGVVTFDPMVL